MFQVSRYDPNTKFFSLTQISVLVSSIFSVFKEFKSNFELRLEEWKVIFDHMEPHTLTFPKPYHDITRFERMVILRCIRPDKIVPAVQQFVQGKKRKKKRKNLFARSRDAFVTRFFFKEKKKGLERLIRMKRENKKKEITIEISLYEERKKKTRYDPYTIVLFKIMETGI